MTPGLSDEAAANRAAELPRVALLLLLQKPIGVVRHSRAGQTDADGPFRGLRPLV
jgi:hypothetical protein